MDMNVVVIGGRIAAPPELRELDSGSRLLRSLVTTRSDGPPSRVDVLPVVVWDPDFELAASPGEPGTNIWIVATAQRRFWNAGSGRHSRLELVAHEVQLGCVDDEEIAELTASGIARRFHLSIVEDVTSPHGDC